jgi:hypothetical protein
MQSIARYRFLVYVSLTTLLTQHVRELSTMFTFEDLYRKQFWSHGDGADKI